MAGRRRVLVMAPHPDDEALGAGGFIHQAVRQGYDVYVVLMTSGDGFVQDAERYYLSLTVTSEEYIHLGYERQIEAQKAMAALGVPKERVIFLGFPDGGLDHLFLHYDAAALFVSPTTGCSRVPYIESPTYGTPYTGAELLNAIIRLFTEIQPDWVVTPLMLDQHPDHWATSAFGSLALMACRAQGLSWAEHTVHLGYLVHWNGWPLPLAYRPEMRQEVPPALTTYPGLRWEEFGYDAPTVEAKRVSLLSYESQVELIKPFLLAFARKTEVFGRVTPTVVDQEAVWPQPRAESLTKFLRRDYGIVASRWRHRQGQDHVQCRVKLEGLWSARVVVYAWGKGLEFSGWTSGMQGGDDPGLLVTPSADHVDLTWSVSETGTEREWLKGIVFYRNNKITGRTGFWPWLSADPERKG
ncbi:hypothetical protein BXT84_10250 [Sulfobacillus thermotolerans]|uniref:PIG-L family deacetylase n=1 Tax=Sulfobacillus thermotolerans TaxID=338644 RepID=A0ABM6RS67_9FIRM|nr:hypothetical protein BXT84_10250 [Sulfobacillus thermotolerans]